VRGGRGGGAWRFPRELRRRCAMCCSARGPRPAHLRLRERPRGGVFLSSCIPTRSAPHTRTSARPDLRRGKCRGRCRGKCRGRRRCRCCRKRKSLLAAAGRDRGALTIGTLPNDDPGGGAGRLRAFAARGRHQGFHRGQHQVEPVGPGRHQAQLVRFLDQRLESRQPDAIGSQSDGGRRVGDGLRGGAEGRLRGSAEGQGRAAEKIAVASTRPTEEAILEATIHPSVCPCRPGNSANRSSGVRSRGRGTLSGQIA